MAFDLIEPPVKVISDKFTKQFHEVTYQVAGRVPAPKSASWPKAVGVRSMATPLAGLEQATQVSTMVTII